MAVDLIRDFINERFKVTGKCELTSEEIERHFASGPSRITPVQLTEALDAKIPGSFETVFQTTLREGYLWVRLTADNRDAPKTEEEQKE